MKKWMQVVPKKFAHMRSNAKTVISNRSGEGFVDTAVKILMAVVIGALVLGGLYLLFEGTILPTLTQRIKEMFNYKG
ncbi:hypothetical protein P40081_27330 [Paenibacillus sp. FSL P4-0081]|uniref:DUF6133 family protein n=1 Tax=Paenibacillus sp. FSL P4-0081 TaxID=1536769 RepID=UPI0004F6EE2A|nr:DUF6133 family protein [Paenibacillus sp. FSL P4-0081]AIQ31455.1 hypothetical protein P40081_27330 [Paenibacillus sp. FSL P4-0081]